MKKFEGTWLMIKNGNDYSDPEFIEFNEKKVIYFGVSDEENNGTLTKKEMWSENLTDTKIESINANRIRFLRKGKIHKVLSETESITENKIFKVDYERIEPTQTNLTKNQIEGLAFSTEWNNEKIHFVFNRDLDIPVIQDINKRLKREGRKLILEKLNETYFGAIYDNGKRETLIPIREIDNRKVTLYGFPKEPYEIIGDRKKYTPQHR